MLDKAYDPKATEDRIYEMWESSGAFTADTKSKKEPFTISMPPPNATGSLHLGHAVMLAIEDILIRFNRMRGKEALWVPGTDHAAIATENVVIKQLKEGGMKDPRKELGREKLVAEIAKFVEGSKDTIRGQVRKMGSSCDWTRERYTFEPSLNRLVNEVFAQMKEDGLIYRGHRIVNWDPNLQTTVSDDEIDHKEETIPFYTFQYGPFQISTARPETKFGDKYVVMHPDDERYAKYKHGQTLDLEWINGPTRATVIKDEAVDPAFGTGCMTITPWHDAVDFEIAERHGLEKEQVIDFSGKLLPIAGEFAGQHISKARPLIVEKLKEKGLLVKTDENYVHNKATNSRGGGTIEPQIKLQWFVDVKKPVVDWKGQKMSLKEVMHDVVHHGDIRIIPDRFEKTYFSWIDNLRDWCVSRQIWWGHRVPVFYCTKCKNEDGSPLDWCYVGAEPITKHELCGSPVEQDPDTLDTWFSSALWTWSTLIDPKLTRDYELSLADMLKQSPDFQKFHPTNVMETGYDLIFFWVARMILMTTYATGQVPFKTVYFHGLVRTKEGKKMSKSDPKTMIDPLDIIPKYGADALRLSMIVGQGPGADSKLYEEKIAGYRNFVNKLWNASRFVLMECEKQGFDPHSTADHAAKTLADKWLVEATSGLITAITSDLESYQLSSAGDRLYAFTWNEFCDWYLELSKGESNPALLIGTLRTLLVLLHPFCPFVTERLWEEVKPAGAGALIAAAWPEATASRYAKEYAELQHLIDTITAVRRLRTAQAVEPAKEVTVTIVSQKHGALLQGQEAQIKRLAKVSSLTFAPAAPAGETASEFLTDIEVYLSLEGLVDTEKEKAALGKERELLQKGIASSEVKLKDETFVSKAPEKVVNFEKQKLQEMQEKFAKVQARLKELGA